VHVVQLVDGVRETVDVVDGLPAGALLDDAELAIGARLPVVRMEPRQDHAVHDLKKKKKKKKKKKARLEFAPSVEHKKGPAACPAHTAAYVRRHQERAKKRELVEINPPTVVEQPV
jgi:hypothetical protein